MREYRSHIYKTEGDGVDVLLTDCAALIKEAVEALTECADDLEAELKERWCTKPEGTCHPALQSKFDRDMVTVVKARALVTKLTGEKQ
jgi:hypothetical protein